MLQRMIDIEQHNIAALRPIMAETYRAARRFAQFERAAFIRLGPEMDGDGERIIGTGIAVPAKLIGPARPGLGDPCGHGRDRPAPGHLLYPAQEGRAANRDLHRRGGQFLRIDMAMPDIRHRLVDKNGMAAKPVDRVEQIVGYAATDQQSMMLRKFTPRFLDSSIDARIEPTDGKCGHHPFLVSIVPTVSIA